MTISWPSAEPSPPPSLEPSLSEHLRVIWHYRWRILIGAVAVAAATFLWRSSAEDRFEATSRIRISAQSERGVVLDDDQIEFATSTYAELAETPRVVIAAAERSGLEIDASEATRRLDVRRTQPAGFLDIVATGSTAADAARLADAMAAALVIRVDADRSSVEPTDETSVSVTAGMVESAELPGSPVAPTPARDAALAFIVAAIVLAEGIVIARWARGALPINRTTDFVADTVGIACVDPFGDRGEAAPAQFVTRQVADRSTAVVVQAGGPPSAAGAMTLARAVDAGGRRAVLLDGDATTAVRRASCRTHPTARSISAGGANGT